MIGGTYATALSAARAISGPTLPYGFCEGVLTWLIRDGTYGDLNFTKDLAVVLISHWEGNVMEKNREFGFLIDPRANSAERVALERIFTGHAGGAFAAWRYLTIRLDGVEFVPMTVTHDAEPWRVEVPGLVDGLSRIRNTWCRRTTRVASITHRVQKWYLAFSRLAKRNELGHGSVRSY